MPQGPDETYAAGAKTQRGGGTRGTGDGRHLKKEGPRISKQKLKDKHKEQRRARTGHGRYDEVERRGLRT